MYKSNWLRHVTRLNNRMPKIMRNVWPNGRRRLGRPLKRLLDETETGLLTPNSWRIFIIIVIITISRCVTRGEEGKVRMLCLFVLLVKVGWWQGEGLESEEVVVMGSDWYVRSMQNRKGDQYFWHILCSECFWRAALCRRFVNVWMVAWQARNVT